MSREPSGPTGLHRWLNGPTCRSGLPDLQVPADLLREEFVYFSVPRND